MKAILPSRFLAGPLEQLPRQVINRTMGEMEELFAKSYATWDRQPKFERKFTRLAGGGMSGKYFTTDQVYRWVSAGTGTWGPTGSPYLIPKDEPRLLVFPSVYTAKTSVESLESGPGGSSGDLVFMFGQVEHPGIEPRLFDEKVKAILEPLFITWALEMLHQAAYASGHLA